MDYSKRDLVEIKEKTKYLEKIAVILEKNVALTQETINLVNTLIDTIKPKKDKDA